MPSTVSAQPPPSPGEGFPGRGTFQDCPGGPGLAGLLVSALQPLWGKTEAGAQQHRSLGGGPISSPGGQDRPPTAESPGHYREEGPRVQHISTQAFSPRDALLQDCVCVRAGFKTCSLEREGRP